MYGHALGGAVGLGYICNKKRINTDWILDGNYSIEIAGTRFDTEISIKPMYDPNREKIKL